MTLPSALSALEIWFLYSLFSAFAQSLPSPEEFGGIWYKSFYKFCALLSSDFKSFSEKYTPSTKKGE